MVINTNVEASSTANNLNVSQSQLAKSLSRLSSGSKIIQPSDDAAGLAVASRLKAQIKRLDSALSNVINAVSFTQTQDGFMKTIDAALRRMGELAMLAQDTTKSGDDIKLYNEEFTQLKDYINATKLQKFNDVDLFGSSTLAVTVDAGGSTFGMPPVDLSVEAYDGALSVETTVGAVAQVDKITISSSGAAGGKFNVTVNGVTLTGIAVGAGDGWGAVTTTNIANAINANGTLSGQVTATTSGAQVIITAKTAGTALSGTTTI
ncbi:MAG: flagellin, partial [Verrucomicrobiota bacterium]|nr:flagellin [Verrucomicrobiota bacterium]